MKHIQLWIPLFSIIIASCTGEMPGNDVPAEYAYVIRSHSYENTSLIDSMCHDLELVMKNHSVPYGAVIVADCRNGEILGIAEYSHRGYFKGEYINKYLVCSSLFKIVTLSGAIGKGLYKPDSKVKYFGSMYSELDNYHVLRKKALPNYSSIRNAMAKSNNPAFAEIGLVMGEKNILEYGDKLLFNKTVLRGMNTGYIEEISSQNGIAKLSAGLDFSYTTVFHQLMIAMMLGNNGELMVPKINCSDSAIKKRILSETTVDYVMKTMKETVISGTSGKIFRDFGNIAENTYAKTGSLYGYSPEGFYNWFMGIYKGNKTNYAVISVIVNDPIWEIKASYMGLKAIQLLRKYADN